MPHHSKSFVKKYAEYKQIFENDEILRSSLDLLPNIAFILDKDFQVLEINDIVVKKLGYTGKSLKGKSFFTVLKDDCKKDIKDRFKNIKKDYHKARGFFECSVLNKVGKPIDFLLTDKLFLEDEEVKFIIVLGTDISEQKLMESELSSTSKFLEQIIDSNSIPSFVLDRKGAVLYWNKACESITGVSRDDIIGEKTAWKAFYDKSRPVMANLVLDDVDEKTLLKYYPDARKSPFVDGSYFSEVFFPNLGPSGKWLYFTAVPIRDLSGNIIAAVENLQDITDLKTSSQRLDLVLTATDSGLWDWNIETGDVYFSDTYYTMLGYKPGDFPMSFDSWKGLIHKDDLEFSVNAVEQSIRNKNESFSIEFRLRTKSDDYIWINGKGDVVEYDNDGNPLRMIGTHHNINERKLYERKIIEEKAKLSSLFRASPVGIGLVKDRMIVDVNDRFIAIMGYELDEVKNKSVRMLYPSTKEFDEVGDEIYGQMENKGIGVIESKMKTKDGKILDVIISCSPIDKNDLSKGVTFSLLDITEFELTEKKFRHLFNGIKSGVAVYKADDKCEKFYFTDYNASAEKMDGVKKSDILGKEVQTVFPGVKDFGLIDVFKEVCRTGESKLHPTTQYKDDRLEAWRDNYVYKLPSGEIVSVYSDLTSEKLKEIKIEQLNERFDIAADSAGIGVWDHDLINNKVHWDNRMYELYGIAHNEFKDNYKFWKTLIYEKDRSRVDHEIKKSIESGENLEVEFRINYTKEKKIRYIKAYARLVYNKENKPYRMIGVNYDITARKLAEEKLNQALNELESSNRELKKLNDFMIGRELRMRELKRQIKDLEEELKDRNELDQ